jgi:hypothetical protein
MERFNEFFLKYQKQTEITSYLIKDFAQVERGCSRMKLRVFLRVIMATFLIVLNGCADSSLHKGTGKNEYEFVDGEFPPLVQGYIVAKGNKYEMARGNYEWTKGSTTVQTDAAGPTQIAETYKAIQLAPNQKVKIDVEQSPQLTTYIWSQDEPMKQSTGKEISVPANPGRYIYEVVAKWSNGEVSYTFVIEVK